MHTPKQPWPSKGKRRIRSKIERCNFTQRRRASSLGGKNRNGNIRQSQYALTKQRASFGLEMMILLLLTSIDNAVTFASVSNNAPRRSSIIVFFLIDTSICRRRRRFVHWQCRSGIAHFFQSSVNNYAFKTYSSFGPVVVTRPASPYVRIWASLNEYDTSKRTYATDRRYRARTLEKGATNLIFFNKTSDSPWTRTNPSIRR